MAMAVKLAGGAPAQTGADDSRVRAGDSRQPLLELRDFCVSFVDGEGRALEAVNRVSLTVRSGEVVGVVGESGCGKSVMAQSILRLLEHDRRMGYAGQVLLDGRDLLQLPLKDMRGIRGADIAMIFQDPLSSLNPVMTIGAQVVEAVRAHRKVSRREARVEAIELLEKVGIDRAAERFHTYPGEFSGGMRQRVMIAMALASKPRLLIADEPTTALDTTTQKQILDLLSSLNRSEGMAILLISHDLNCVASFCERVNVMYLGQIVEEIDSAGLLRRPAHPYAQGLIASVPPLAGDLPEKLPDIPGSVPPLTDVPAGCRFAPRCSLADARCRLEEPAMVDLGGGDRVKCWKRMGEEAALHQKGVCDERA